MVNKVKSIFTGSARPQLKRFAGTMISPLLSPYELDYRIKGADFKKVKESIEATVENFREEGYIDGIISSPTGKDFSMIKRSIEMLAALSLIINRRIEIRPNRYYFAEKTSRNQIILITMLGMYHPHLYAPHSLRDCLYIKSSAQYEESYYAYTALINSKIDYILGLKGSTRPTKIIERAGRRSVEEKTGPCAICKSRNKLTVHHIIPRRYGGESNAGNYLILCANCHNTKKSIETLIHMLENAVISMNGTGLYPPILPLDFGIALFNAMMVLNLYNHFKDEELFYSLTHYQRLFLKNVVNEMHAFR